MVAKRSLKTVAALAVVCVCVTAVVVSYMVIRPPKSVRDARRFHVLCQSIIEGETGSLQESVRLTAGNHDSAFRISVEVPVTFATSGALTDFVSIRPELVLGDYPPLILAVLCRRQEALELLLANGADPDVRDSKQCSPLHYAVAHADTKMVEALLEAKASPNVENIDGWSPLHIAIADHSATTAKVLLDAGADVNIAQRVFSAPIFMAVAYGDPSLVKLLAGHGADLSAKNRYGLKITDILGPEDDSIRRVLAPFFREREP